MFNYSVEIRETSAQLSTKQRVSLKDTTDALKLDILTENEPVIIKPKFWAILAIHNDKSDDKDYENYIIVDESNTKFVTGSASFWNSFMNIATEMAGEDEEWSIKVYRVESKNYKGKSFITCSII